MQPLSLLRALKRDCIDYVSGKYPFLANERPDLDAELRALLSERGTLFQDPVLQLGRARKKASFDFSLLEPAIRSTVQVLPELKAPYAHQTVAWRQILNNVPTVVSTGTGSGKSESFIIPVLDGLLKQGVGGLAKEVGALFIYPMNALVQDQFVRIFKYAVGSGFRVGIYNGAFKELKEDERRKICTTLSNVYSKLKETRPDLEVGYDFTDPNTLVVDPDNPKTYPHILLTNYKMLEYMLLRAQDQPLVEAFNLKYLVLDEAHTYTGTLALEVSCLLTRLRVHLGESKSDYLPVATSATLAGGQDQEESLEAELSRFFTKLFGKRFPQSGFLVGEQYEELPNWNPVSFLPFLKVDPKRLSETLAIPFPKNLEVLADTFFEIKSNSSDTLANQLYQQLKGLESQITSVLLSDQSGRVTTTTISWELACSRFKERVGGSVELLEGLLICLSQAFEDIRFPLLGLRVHVFARSEPKLLWTVDGKHVGDEKTIGSQGALSLVSCKRCGQMALAGQGENAGGDGNASGELVMRPLGDFWEEVETDASVDTYVFHPEISLSPEDQEALGKDWDLDRFDLLERDGTVFAQFISEATKPRGTPFVRVQRKSKVGKQSVIAGDFESCPRCGATAKKDSPVIVTHRGGAATDISVYTASALTNTADPKEQKLLIFSDNRQETSFLAGFLTDRHRKINLRRALTGYLEECKLLYNRQSVPVTYQFNRESKAPQGFDLAARLLLSLEQGKAFDPNASLPQSLVCRKTTLQNLIPRSVLDRPYWEKRGSNDDEEVESLKQWLLENYRMGASADPQGGSNGVETLELLDGSFRGKWILALLTELLLLDLAAGGAGEGHLSTLGLAGVHATAFSEAAFEEFARSNADLGLGARGIFILSKWLLDELLYAGAWSDLDRTGKIRKGFLPKHLSILEPRFICEKQEQGLLGRSVNRTEGLHVSSRLSRILVGLDPDQSEELRKIWAKKSTWDRLINVSPLNSWVFYSDQGTDAPLLRFYAAWEVTTQIQRYSGSVTHSEFCVAPVAIDLEGIPTGKRRGDVWTKIPTIPNPYYLRLLKTPLREQSKLVRAREHNGMLSAADANDALLKFEKDVINTLVATPTLEMGVDLPDLPTVIHRSVPPAASNYAQRAGRAGRGPKRALLLTYCGLGSHDMTFFEQPTDMVTGEILPPGIPDRNPFIIKRHIQGLILEVMGLNRPKLGPSMKMRFWHEFVDVTDLRNRLLEVTRNSRNRPEFTDSGSGSNWKDILSARRSLQQEFIDRFIAELDRSLWIDVGNNDRERLNELKNELRRCAAEFSDNFQKQIGAYRGLVISYLDSLETYRIVPNPDELSQFRQAKRFAEVNLGARTRNSYETPRPLNDLAATGFLPNFDFPGQVIRFKGLKDDPKSVRSDVPQEDRVLQYDRGGIVALREFAPAQKVYGHGFIYDVQRYLENDLVENQARGYGVCSEGCTTLAPPESDVCPECQGPVLKIQSPQSPANRLPEIVQIREVHGSQLRAISDGANFRERHFFTEEARRVGAPMPDEEYLLDGNSEVGLSLHLTKDHYLKTVFLVLNTKSRSSLTAQKVFYRKRSSGTLFQVALEPKEGEADWEPFIPSIQIEGQGIVFQLPHFVAHQEGLIAHGEADGLKPFQATLCTLIRRSAQRILRLGPRSGQFDIQVHRVMEQRGDGFSERASSFVLLDREPGGSGVIPLIWDSWDEILERVRETILKNCCETSCYRCLRSFDNQSEHALLDKRLFRIDGQAPISDFLKRSHFKKRDRGETKPVDSRSPAESAFKDLLLKQFPQWALETQVERMNTSGGLLSIPDFELTREDGAKKLTVFIDGWKYHQSPRYFFGDLRKRNELARRGYTVITLPAGEIIGRLNLPLLETLLSGSSALLRPFPVVEGLDVPDGHIPSNIDPVVTEHLIFLGVKVSELKLIHLPNGLKALSQSQEPLARLICDYSEKVSKYTRPIALFGEDQIIVRVNQAETLSDESKWRALWIFHSCLSIVGYRPIVIWTGPKPS